VGERGIEIVEEEKESKIRESKRARDGEGVSK